MDTIRAQIELLIDLQGRLHNLRRIPPHLLKAPINDSLSLSTHGLLSEFHQIKELSDIVRSDPIQEALRAAKDSLKVDSTDLNTSLRRESRKRRRPPSPESPKPYIALERKTISLFPLVENNTPHLQTTTLPAYICDFNATHRSKLHLWRRTRGMPHVGQPTILRFIIPEVFTAYLTLVALTSSSLLIESLTVFAPRERKSPHSQSDFVVYRILSQQIAKMLHSHPQVRIESVMDLLCSYSGLFIERCISCERVLSTEGHVPPVVRLWVDGCWRARHITCRVG